jgi:hypothetical protein
VIALSAAYTGHTGLLQLAAELEAWRAMRGTAESDSLLSIEVSDTATTEQQQQQREADGTSVPKTGLDAPKHGKEGENNDPHVGGNTWAGGTGGSGKSAFVVLYSTTLRNLPVHARLWFDAVFQPHVPVVV